MQYNKNIFNNISHRRITEHVTSQKLFLVRLLLVYIDQVMINVCLFSEYFSNIYTYWYYKMVWSASTLLVYYCNFSHNQVNNAYYKSLLLKPIKLCKRSWLNQGSICIFLQKMSNNFNEISEESYSWSLVMQFSFLFYKFYCILVIVVRFLCN